MSERKLQGTLTACAGENVSKSLTLLLAIFTNWFLFRFILIAFIVISLLVLRFRKNKRKEKELANIKRKQKNRPRLHNACVCLDFIDDIRNATAQFIFWHFRVSIKSCDSIRQL
jgi:Na+-transporting methylmalonyl-CoA/oxaloacetate decarboxylase gamma subunit